jgi:hypothetical protein
MAKQTKKEYQVARRKSYETKRRAVEDADPKLQRQLKDIEDQFLRRRKKGYTEWRQGMDEGVNIASFSQDSYSLNVRKMVEAESEKKRRTARAKAKSRARSKK